MKNLMLCFIFFGLTQTALASGYSACVAFGNALGRDNGLFTGGPEADCVDATSQFSACVAKYKEIAGGRVLMGLDPDSGAFFHCKAARKNFSQCMQAHKKANPSWDETSAFFYFCR